METECTDTDDQDEGYTMKQLLSTKALHIPLLIACMLQVVQQLSGINAVCCVTRGFVYYYRFIVRFPIRLDLLFITFFLHFFLLWTSSLPISCSAISASTLSNYVLLGLTTGLLPSTLNSIHFLAQSSSFPLITCPYRLILPLLMIVVICSIPISFLNSSLVFHGNATHPSAPLLFQTVTQHQLARA